MPKLKKPKPKAKPKATPRPAKPQSLIDHDLDESIRRRIARLGGTLNGQRLYLDPNGDPTYTKPEEHDNGHSRCPTATH